MNLAKSIQITNDPLIKGIVEQIVKSAQPIFIYLDLHREETIE